MSYIDILVIGITAFGLLIGLIGKFPKKLVHLGAAILAPIVAAFACGAGTVTVMELDSAIVGGEGTVETYISDTLSSLLSEYGISADSIMGMLTGVVQVIAFWVLSIFLFLVFGLIGDIVAGILFHKSAKGTAKKSFGLIGAAKGLVVGLVLIVPVAAFSPILNNIGEVITDESSAETIETVQDQINSSFFIKLEDKVFSSVKVSFMTYEVNGEKRYLYDDIESIGGFTKIAALFTDMEDKEPAEVIMELDDDEIREIFNAIEESPTVKETIGDVIESLDLPVEINVDDIDFSKEADTFIYVKNILETDEEGNVTVDPEKIDTNELVDVIAKSDLVTVVAESAEGMLSDVDDSTRDEIDTLLQAKVSDGTMTQDKYETLMGLFTAK